MMTRRGKSEAKGKHDQLARDRPDFWEAYQEFLRRNPDFSEDALEPEEWLAGVRDSSSGREFSW